MIRLAAGGVVAVLLMVSPGSGAYIDVGEHWLKPNTSNQTIKISVDGVEQVAGLNLNVQIGDGHPPGDGEKVPAITQVDILQHPVFGDTIFGAVPNMGSFGRGKVNDQLFVLSTVASSGAVAAKGLLAVITVDTTGILENPPGGFWEFRLKDTLNSTTQLIDDSKYAEPIATLTIMDGRIALVPEPPMFVLLLGVAIGLPLLYGCARRRRERSG